MKYKKDGQPEEIYDFLESESGQLLLVISAQEDIPHRPEVICNGSDMAMFCRNGKSSMSLSNLHPDVIPALKASKCLEVAEMKGNKIARHYEASVNVTGKKSWH